MTWHDTIFNLAFFPFPLPLLLLLPPWHLIIIILWRSGAKVERASGKPLDDYDLICWLGWFSFKVFSAFFRHWAGLLVCVYVLFCCSALLFSHLFSSHQTSFLSVYLFGLRAESWVKGNSVKSNGGRERVELSLSWMVEVVIVMMMCSSKQMKGVDMSLEQSSKLSLFSYSVFALN